MPPFQEPYIPDVNGMIRSQAQGFAYGNQLRQNALAQQAGQLAAGGNMSGAANALLSGGELDAGLNMQDRIRKMAKEADEETLAKSQRANDLIFRLASVADTPEKWSMATGKLRQMGVDISGYEDFGTRETALARFGTTKDVLDSVLEERKARMIGQALLPQQAGGMDAWKQSVASIESANSANPYQALGPTVRSGDRAYGKYQVMGANVGPWTREILGQELTPEQFLSSPEAQEKVFEGKFGQYVQKTGSPQAAASMWFTGRPSAPNARARDANGNPLGITGQQYVDKFTAGMGGETPQQAQSGGLNYDAAIRAALTAGDVELAMKLQSVATPNKSRYTASRQGILDTHTGEIKPLPAGVEGSDAEYGTSLNYYRGKDGRTYAFQASKGGGRKDLELPEGAEILPGIDYKDIGTGFIPLERRSGQQAGPVVPKNIAGKEAQEASGKSAGNAMAALPAATTTVQEAKITINKLRNHPGLNAGTGASSTFDPRNWIPGTAAYDFQEQNKQAEGQSFMAAREALKGAGQVTDFEGRKGEQAIANLRTAQSKEQYLDALTTLERMMDQSLADLNKKAGLGRGGAAAGGDPMSQARDAIARGALRDAVIERLRQNGIDPAGL
jgi:hypothetical protein